MVKRLVQSRVFHMIVGVSVAYFLIIWPLDNASVINVLNGIFSGVMVSVAIMFWPLVWEALRAPRFARSDHLALGIGLVWMSAIIGRALSIYARIVSPEAVGAEGEIANNPFIGYLTLLIVIGGGLHITGLGLDDKGRWDRSSRRTPIALIAGALVAAGVIALQFPS